MSFVNSMLALINKSTFCMFPWFWFDEYSQCRPAFQIDFQKGIDDDVLVHFELVIDVSSRGFFWNF